MVSLPFCPLPRQGLPSRCRIASRAETMACPAQDYPYGLSYSPYQYPPLPLSLPQATLGIDRINASMGSLVERFHESLICRPPSWPLHRKCHTQLLMADPSPSTVRVTYRIPGADQ